MQARTGFSSMSYRALFDSDRYLLSCYRYDQSVSQEDTEALRAHTQQQRH